VKSTKSKGIKKNAKMSVLLNSSYKPGKIVTPKKKKKPMAAISVSVNSKRTINP
jgi:hypothetical protein